MSARRALLEDVEFDVTAGEFAAARRATVEPDTFVTTAVLPKYEAQRTFAKPTPTRATRRNRTLVGAGLAAAFVLAPFIMPVHAEYAKAPEAADLVEYQDVTEVSLQSIAAQDAAERAEQRREAQRQAEAEAQAQRQAEEEARRQAEEAERQAAEAREREAQAQREREQAASRSAERTAAPAAPAAAPAEQVVTAEVSGDAAGAVSYAMAQLGKPYVWGGTGPNGYDCSGLIYAAYQSLGITLPRTSGAMMSAGRPVGSVAELQPGDIIISYGGGHAAMYIGNGMVVEALNFGIPVKTNPLPSGITAMRRVIG